MKLSNFLIEKKEKLNIVSVPIDGTLRKLRVRWAMEAVELTSKEIDKEIITELITLAKNETVRVPSRRF